MVYDREVKCFVHLKGKFAGEYNKYNILFFFSLLDLSPSESLFFTQ